MCNSVLCLGSLRRGQIHRPRFEANAKEFADWSGKASVWPLLFSSCIGSVWNERGVCARIVPKCDGKNAVKAFGKNSSFGLRLERPATHLCETDSSNCCCIFAKAGVIFRGERFIVGFHRSGVFLIAANTLYVRDWLCVEREGRNSRILAARYLCDEGGCLLDLAEAFPF